MKIIKLFIFYLLQKSGSHVLNNINGQHAPYCCRLFFVRAVEVVHFGHLVSHAEDNRILERVPVINAETTLRIFGMLTSDALENVVQLGRPVEVTKRQRNYLDKFQSL
ncbi:hypothetical protein T02_14265 [Trichinella nativa]|uniref:Uncharacterized protein n=2 Tax=Trichinella TaxID=6333 RepID=A0A0V1KSE1_9BILA|nr:hypothetical protein T05_10008 [Trichinella murrelli]KRX65886.1 hypothetical protein T09_13005 [Trichinella sp. T9]KRZ50275.1 hypothetical protein T02_14265 [Trichinella nativa]